MTIRRRKRSRLQSDPAELRAVKFQRVARLLDLPIADSRASSEAGRFGRRQPVARTVSMPIAIWMCTGWRSAASRGSTRSHGGRRWDAQRSGTFSSGADSSTGMPRAKARIFSSGSSQC